MATGPSSANLHVQQDRRAIDVHKQRSVDEASSSPSAQTTRWRCWLLAQSSESSTGRF